MSELEPVVSDAFYPITINGGEARYLINAKYDRIDTWLERGEFLLKIYDDEDGLITMHIDEETAWKVHEASGIPMVFRESILQSEFDFIVEARARQLTDEMFGGFDEQEDIE